jgi:hypothetical protein
LWPAFDSSDDFFWIFGPGEGLGLLIMFDQLSIDNGLQIDHAFENAAFEVALCEDAEEKGFIPQILSTRNSAG